MGNERNNKRKVAAAGAGYVIGNYLLKGITFLSAPIFTRLLSTSDYGDVGAYTSYESIIYIILGLALHSSINNAKYKYREKLDEYVSSLVLLAMVSTVVWSFFANIFYDLYSGRLGFSRFVVNVLILHAFASSLHQIYNSYISLNYEYKSYLKMSYFHSIANMLMSIVLIVTLFSEDRATGRIIGIFLPMFMIGGYIVFYFFKKSRPRADLAYWKYGLTYSLPIVPHGISQVILNSFDRIMIREMIGKAEAGIYNFSYVINSIVTVAKTALENVWKPWVYDKMERKEYGAIRKGISNYVWGISIFTSMVMMVSPEVIKVLGDREYWDSTACVVPVLMGGFFAFMYSIPSIIEYYYEKTRFIAIGTCMAAAVNVALNYVFIPKYGYIAAAYTTLFTYFLYFLFHYFIARKLQGSDIFPKRNMIFASLAVLAVGAVSLWLESLWLVRWLLEILIAALAAFWVNKEFDAFNMLKSVINKHKKNKE